MKELVYCKIAGQVGKKNNILIPFGKYNLTKHHSAGINANLKKFKEGDRVRITIEKMNKEEFVKAVYGNSEKARDIYKKKAYGSLSDKFWIMYVIPTVLKRDGNKCVKCGSTKNLDVAHKKYSKNLTINDLETLCRSCHKKFDNK